MWFSFLFTLILNASADPATRRESQARSGTSRDFNWAVGVTGAVVLPTSTTFAPLSPSLGLGFSVARGTRQHMAWYLAFERSAHILEGTGSAFKQGTESPIPDDAAEGTARQIWSQLGLRWSPRLGGHEQARITGVLGWGIGAVHSRNTLDVPAPVVTRESTPPACNPAFKLSSGSNSS